MLCPECGHGIKPVPATQYVVECPECGATIFVHGPHSGIVVPADERAPSYRFTYDED